VDEGTATAIDGEESIREESTVAALAATTVGRAATVVVVRGVDNILGARGADMTFAFVVNVEVPLANVSTGEATTEFLMTFVGVDAVIVEAAILVGGIGVRDITFASTAGLGDSVAG